jgi:hypothetical protein
MTYLLVFMKQSLADCAMGRADLLKDVAATQLRMRARERAQVGL